MTYKQTLIAGAGALLLQLPAQVQAFECPSSLAEAKAAIEKADDSIKHMESGMPMSARSYLKEARMSLAEAEHHNAKDEHFHCARAIVRADEALGYAVAAYYLSRTGVDK